MTNARGQASSKANFNTGKSGQQSQSLTRAGGNQAAKNNEARRKSQKITYSGQAGGQVNKGNNASRPMVYQSLALQSTDSSRAGQL